MPTSGGPASDAGLQAGVVRAVLIYLVLIATAEVLVAFVSPEAGALLDAALILMIINHFVLLFGKFAQPSTPAADRRLISALAVLALLPLLRFTSLVMPFTEFPENYWLALVGGPLLLAAGLAVRTLGLTPAEVGLRLRGWPLQIAIGAAGVPLGLVAFLLQNPDAPAGSTGDLLVKAAILVVFVAFTEELIFRGLVQRTFDGILGLPGFVWSTCLFMLVYLGSRSPGEIAFAGVVGLLFGLCVQRTQSIVGVFVAHSVLLVGLVVVWPQVM
jgi:membrane protease YdiL (CAAX protease family)